eukprot:4533747-Prymnesium_polylepis.1
MTTSNKIERRRVYTDCVHVYRVPDTPRARPRETVRLRAPGPRTARRQCNAHTTRSPALKNIPLAHI